MRLGERPGLRGVPGGTGGQGAQVLLLVRVQLEWRGRRASVTAGLGRWEKGTVIGATLLYPGRRPRRERAGYSWIQQPTDGGVRIVARCVCGMNCGRTSRRPLTDHPRHMGHEFIGVVEETGGRRGPRSSSATWPSSHSPTPTTPASTAVAACRPPARTAASGASTGSTVTRARPHASRMPTASLVKLPRASESSVTAAPSAALAPPSTRKSPSASPSSAVPANPTGGVAPARAYMEELMPYILRGEIRPGRIFDRTVPLDQVAEAYRLVAERPRGDQGPRPPLTRTGH